MNLGLRYLVIVVLFFVSCSRNEKSIGSRENPVVIGLSYPYYENLSEKDFNKLKSKIENDMGLFIDFKTEKDSVAILELIGRKKVDIAFLTLNEYLIAREYYQVKPKLMVLRDKNKNSYYGVIATFSNNIKKIEDLNGKKIATRSPYSISGFVLPSIVFSKLKIKPQFVFTESFENAVDMLKKGEVDAASFYKSLVEKDKSLKLIHEFGPIPNEPVVCRSRFDDFLCSKFMNEFVKLSQEKEFKEIFSKMADITGFEEVQLSDYRDLHQILREYSSSIYSLIPEGIKIKKISEEYRMD